jgi:hypothetical protein
MKPPYPAPYWGELTDRQRVNDLVHKICQKKIKNTYGAAYAFAVELIDAPGKGSWPERLERAGKLKAAISTLIDFHVGTENDKSNAASQTAAGGIRVELEKST